jgi:phosphoacetylglucosamine mutase
MFIRSQMKLLDPEGKNEGIKSLKIGVVQTAYANGASRNYLKSVNLETALVKTGVKYLHNKAHHYDVGIYFEANGHGTVLFSKQFVREIGKLELESYTVEQQAQRRILAFANLLNQATGDAISDLLAVLGVLIVTPMSYKEWTKLYEDFPSRQLKVKVKDRNLIKTTDDECSTVAPSGLQEKIDHLVSSVKNGRAFVRPSGTEDVVRIYAEASTQEEANDLATLVAQAAYDCCFGIGERPELDSASLAKRAKQE